MVAEMIRAPSTPPATIALSVPSECGSSVSTNSSAPSNVVGVEAVSVPEVVEEPDTVELVGVVSSILASRLFCSFGKVS